MTRPVTPVEFFDRARPGDQIKLGANPEPWDVLTIAKGSHARIARKNDTKTTFAYLSGELLRFENLQGPSFNSVEFVQ